MKNRLSSFVCVLFTAAMCCASITPAAAASDCEAKAVSKTGKPLHGAAKTAFIKKCEREGGGAATVEHGTSAKVSQQEKMAACNKEATGKKGDERKAFMKECLSK